MLAEHSLINFWRFSFKTNTITTFKTGLYGHVKVEKRIFSLNFTSFKSHAYVPHGTHLSTLNFRQRLVASPCLLHSHHKLYDGVCTALYFIHRVVNHRPTSRSESDRNLRGAINLNLFFRCAVHYRLAH